MPINRRFAAFSWGVLGYNLLVILWGAFVRATGSGAGCGDHWPLCNGEVVPRAAEVETLIEFTHRATSGLALLAVVGMLLWARRAYPAEHPVRLGARLSMIFMVLEALVGAALVVLQMVADNQSLARGYWMILHLVNTFLLVAVLALTAWWASGKPPVRLRGQGAPARLLLAGLGAILVVGATGAIAALGDTLFPATSLAEGLRDSFDRESHPFVQLRKLHPLLAVLAGAYLAVAARLAARLRPSRAARRLAGALLGLYLVQLAAGAINVVLLAPVWLQLVHLLLADAVWIAAVLLTATVCARPAPEQAAAAPRRAARALR